MIPLPLVLEQTAASLVIAGQIALAAIALIAFVVLQAWRHGWSSVGGPIRMVALIAAGCAVVALLQPVGWQLRLDDDGVTLAAPFDFFTRQGAIRWSDLQSVDLSFADGRDNPTIEFGGRSGTRLVLKALEGVPDGYWPAMISVVTAKAPEIRFPPGEAQWIAAMRRLALDGRRNTIGGWGLYAAHDGQGRNLN